VIEVKRYPVCVKDFLWNDPDTQGIWAFAGGGVQIDVAVPNECSSSLPWTLARSSGRSAARRIVGRDGFQVSCAAIWKELELEPVRTSILVVLTIGRR